MGFESVPFLISIISSIGAVLRAIWEFAKQRVLMIATFLGIIVPWIVKFVVKWFSWKYLLWGAIALLVGQAVGAAMGVVREIPRLQAIYQDFITMFPGVGWFIWEGPLQLGVLLDGIPGMIRVWVATSVACFVVAKVKWAVQIGLSNALKGVS